MSQPCRSHRVPSPGPWRCGGPAGLEARAQICCGWCGTDVCRGAPLWGCPSGRGCDPPAPATRPGSRCWGGAGLCGDVSPLYIACVFINKAFSSFSQAGAGPMCGLSPGILV